MKEELCKEKSNFLKFLYGSILGRMLLKIFVNPIISKIIGIYMNSRFSRNMIVKFVKENNINLKEYEEKEYKSFNEFFTRKIKLEYRQIDMNEESFISPCDSKLLAYKIDEESTFQIKNSIYTVGEIINNEYIAKKYINGYCLIFRLCVDNYHRYCYIDDGVKTDNFHIKGKLHTVRPIASEFYKVYSRNSREYTLLHTKNFGTVIQTEIGAIGVGKINNFHREGKFKKGMEKGTFEYGGSTIVLFVEQDRIKILDEIIENSNKGIETPVKIGEKIAEKLN